MTAEAGCEGYVSGLLTTTRTRKEAQTSMRRLATTMRWQEGLMFPLPEGTQGEGEVALSLHSWDRFSHHVILGTMRFKLADISMMCNADCWVDLQPPKQVLARAPAWHHAFLAKTTSYSKVILNP